MTDLEKAERIVEKAGNFVGNIGTMRKNIAKAVAQGIALGRKEGMEAAAEIAEKAIRDHIKKSN